MHGTNINTADLFPAARLWELTGTRYLFLNAASVRLLNQHGDPERNGFHILETLRLAAKDAGQSAEDIGDFTVYQDSKATNAMIEYDHVLPRAKLFAHWETPTNDAATLATLLSRDFVPAQTVLLRTNSAVPASAG